MVIVRALVLIVLVAFCWSMGQTPPSQLNAFGKFVSFNFFLMAPILYLLPSIEALIRKHNNFVAIALVNVFLGWTLIGWVVAIVWAASKPVMIKSATSSAHRPVISKTKQCQFCAEDVLAEAIKCKHCGSDLRTEPAK